MGSSESLRAGPPAESLDVAEAVRSSDAPFVVVGVGASAGGLEALSDLLANLPANTGMAVVVVQHLDPQHESKLSNLLSRVTHLPVLEATQDLAVQPDHVYVIPRNTTMTIAQGVLQLAPRGAARVSHLPIDLFLKSLAEDRQSAAIGVILSGTGTDGTLGMEEIKAAGGITFAQDEASAKYSGMPQSAARSGCVDLVLPPDQIARELTRISQHSYVAPDQAAQAGAGPIAEDDVHFKKILAILRAAFRVDFSAYRESTVRRRILRRMVLQTKDNLADYIEHLKRDLPEVEALYQDILINVTSFFREPQTFEVLKERVFPEILRAKSQDTPIRVWVPGCSTGQEAYSLAIALVEFLETQPVGPPILIFATDLSETGSLVKAREGVYPVNIVAEVSPERLRRFFTKEQETYRINKSIRDLCVFAKQNVAVDPPFSHVDLISCRNLLIYLTPVLQKRVIPTFHYALNPNGFLVLGASETIGSFDKLFGVVDPKSRIYVKKTAGLRRYPHFHGRDVFTGEPADLQLTALTTASVDWQRAADSVVLKEYAPAGVLVNDDLDILQFRGQTGDYLTPPPGEPNHNLLKMAREGLVPPLRDALKECRQGNAPVRRTGVRIRGEGAIRETDLLVLPVKLPGTGERCCLVLFDEPRHEPTAVSGSAADATGPNSPARWLPRWLRRPFPRATTSVAAGVSAPPDEGEADRLRQELAAMRDYLQSVIEQKEAVNEELRSANEEILSSNEELRSTNEEMETAKEELQSVNEELVTVNEQLMNRNLELTRVSDDMTNLLGSANVPMVAVGVDLRIRWFTPSAGKVLSLLPADVGRPIGELRMLFDLSELGALITEVIDSVQTEEREVRDRDGHWYMLRIRPYRTAENKIDGAVVVLADIDEAKRAQMRLRESGEYTQSIVDTVRDPLLILTDDLRVKSANQSFYQTFQVKPEETVNLLLYDLGRGQWDLPPLRRLLEDVLPSNRAFEEFEVEHDFPVIGHRAMLLNARRVLPRDGASPLILLAFQDVTEHRQAEAALRQSGERFRFLAESMPQIIFTATPDGAVDYFNRHWTEFTGLSSESIEGLNWTRFVHPADLEENLRHWQHSIDTGDPFQFEHRFRRSDGVYCWHLTRAQALRDAGGHVLIWTGSSTDIDDQKRSEDALKQADTHKNEFLAMLAHELRNPLAALECGLALVSGGGDESDRDWALTMAVHQVQLLRHMIDDLMDTSRITHGTFLLRKERVRTADLIERAVDTVRHLAEAQGHQLHLEVAPNLPQLEADPARLEQVIYNLLTNAFKFTPPGGRVEFSAEAERGELVMSIRDTGGGIAPGFLAHIFEPFAQAETTLARGRSGLGIGLTLVKAIVELHGGSVEARSDGLNRGCEIVVRLPTVGADDANGSGPLSLEDGPTLESGPTPGVDGALERRRILIVEDNLDYALGLRRLLESAGHQVHICNDGLGALSQAPAFAPDVILLDLGLPGMDGYEVARQMRADESLARARIVVVSGYACEEDRRRSREIGVDEHLAKPVRFSELLRIVTETGRMLRT
ncbi:MAG: chemotaxis protein CheB [Isosphaeraceae bacterium]|jgi:two-component system CheB/CheR fusion protein